MAGATLAVYTRALGEQLGECGTFIVSHQAIGPEPARWAIAGSASSHLRSDGSAGRYVGHWLLVTSGGQINQSRRVAGSIPSLGALAVDNPLGGTLAVNDQFDVTWPLPSFTTNGVTGLDALIRQASRDIWVEDGIELVTSAGEDEYSLSSYAGWLTRRDQLVRVLDPPEIRLAGRQYTPSIFPWRLKFDTGTPYLVAGDGEKSSRGYAAAGLQFQLIVRRPGWSLINSSEGAGLVNRTDVANVEQSDMVTVALLYAYRYLATWRGLPPEERQRYADMVPAQEERCKQLAHYDPHTTNGLLAEEAA